MDDLQKQKIELEIQEKELEAAEFVSSFSSGKRILLIALVLLIIPGYFLAKFATAQILLYQFNKSKVTAHPAVVTSLPVEVVKGESGILPITDTNYSAYALIQNTNRDLVATDFSYTFRFLDEDNKVVHSVNDETFLLPGARKYLIVPNVRIDKAPVNVKIEFGEIQWKKRLSIAEVNLQKSIPQYGRQSNPTGFFVEGTIRNNSVYNLRSILISGIVRDSSGEIIAVSQYKADTVGTKESREYRLFWPLDIADLVTDTPEIIVETNVLDQNNLVP